MIELAKLCEGKRSSFEQVSRMWEESGRKRVRRVRKVDVER